MTAGCLAVMLKLTRPILVVKGKKHASKHTRGTQGRSTKTKTVAFGMRERSGETKAFQVKGANAASIMPYILDNVALDGNVHADDNRAYSALDVYYARDRVNHSRGECVRVVPIQTALKAYGLSPI